MTDADSTRSRMHAYAAALLTLVIATAINWTLSAWLAPTNLAMIYLLGVVFTAAQFGRSASVMCALGGVVAFDFFFVPPVFTFRFGDTQYLLTAVILLTVGLVISTLTAHLRRQAKATSQASLAAEEERLRNSLLASISHDLRTPLSIIVGNASHLLDAADRVTHEERQRHLKNIYDEAQYVSRVVSDLLDITRLQSGPIHLDRQWYPLEELLGAALEHSKSSLQHHKVEVQLSPQLPLIYVDGVLIEKLLINLLENAGKYTPADTTVIISAEHHGNSIVIAIADQGPGIPTHALAKLFDKFYRVTTESTVMGAGLGLFICRAITQAHSGSIRTYNRAEGGAVFEVTLPYSTPPTQPAELGA